MKLIHQTLETAKGFRGRDLSRRKRFRTSPALIFTAITAFFASISLRLIIRIACLTFYHASESFLQKKGEPHLCSYHSTSAALRIALHPKLLFSSWSSIYFCIRFAIHFINRHRPRKSAPVLLLLSIDLVLLFVKSAVLPPKHHALQSLHYPGLSLPRR